MGPAGRGPARGAAGPPGPGAAGPPSRRRDDAPLSGNASSLAGAAASACQRLMLNLAPVDPAPMTHSEDAGRPGPGGLDGGAWPPCNGHPRAWPKDAPPPGMSLKLAHWQASGGRLRLLPPSSDGLGFFKFVVNQHPSIIIIASTPR